MRQTAHDWIEQAFDALTVEPSEEEIMREKIAKMIDEELRVEVEGSLPLNFDSQPMGYTDEQLDAYEMMGEDR